MQIYIKILYNDVDNYEEGIQFNDMCWRRREIEEKNTIHIKEES